MKRLKTKEKSYMLLTVIIAGLNLFSASVYSETSTPLKELKEASYFSIGLNGFIGYKSDGEKSYRDILKKENAEELFLDIARDKHATPESKLYAACGLRQLSFNDIDTSFNFNKNTKVSVLQGDILRSVYFTEVYSSIKKHGCN